MRLLGTILALVFSAALASAQGVAVCSGDTYVAYVSWDRDGAARAAAVSLSRPLGPRSESAIDVPDGPVELACGASPRLQPATDGRTHRVRAEPVSSRPLLVTCAGIEGVPTPADDFVRAHPVSSWSRHLRPKADRTSSGDRQESYYVRISAQTDSSTEARRMKVELRERVTDRVELDLVLLDAECPG